MDENVGYYEKIEDKKINYKQDYFMQVRKLRKQEEQRKNYVLECYIKLFFSIAGLSKSKYWCPKILNRLVPRRLILENFEQELRMGISVLTILTGRFLSNGAM